MNGIFDLMFAMKTVFTLTGILLIFGSTTLGVIIGALPGLSATLGIALLSGLTFTMDVTNAVIVLMGIYVGAIYGGSISAILINVPGTGSAAATALDGYPLAKSGHAVSAIKITRAGSMIGTVIGMLCLVSVTPVLTSLALQFTSAEFFLLALFGVMICGNVTAKDLTIKGWIAGLIGILIALVGIDSIQGIHRFTYDVPYFFSGVNLVCAMIGLFAFPQIVKSLRSGEKKGDAKEADKVSLFEAHELKVLPNIIKYLFLIIKSCLIGVGIGTLPGVGENVAAWIAYGHAKSSSKHPEKFGKGAIDGIIAPETANNAAIGGAMIPMLTLAVPGSPPAAVMLGALMLHGLKPGPRLLTTSPMFIYEISAMLLGATFMLWILGSVLSKPLSKIVTVPEGLLLPVIAVLCIIGCYSLNLSHSDILMMFVFGLVGYALDELGYSPATMILGLILGGMLDENFRRTLMLNNGDLTPFYSRPVALIFLVAIVVLLGMPIIKKIKKLKQVAEETVPNC